MLLNLKSIHLLKHLKIYVHVCIYYKTFIITQQFVFESFRIYIKRFEIIYKYYLYKINFFYYALIIVVIYY